MYLGISKLIFGKHKPLTLYINRNILITIHNNYFKWTAKTHDKSEICFYLSCKINTITI